MSAGRVAGGMPVRTGSRPARVLLSGMLALGLGAGVGVAAAQTPPPPGTDAGPPAAGAPPAYVAPGGTAPVGTVGGAGGGPAAAAPRHRFADRFAAANTTGDGHLTLQQAQAAGMKGVVKNFDAIDADHKGYVTMADVRAFHRARHAAAAAARSGGTAP